MADDKSNIKRLDIPDIFDEVASITAMKWRSLPKTFKVDVPLDNFVVTPSEHQQLLRWLMECSSKIASEASYVQTSEQTGLDGISYTVVDDDGNTISREDFDRGMKMEQNNGNELIFNIEGIENPQRRYTVVQQFIRSALINYLLYKWFMIVYPNEANIYYTEYEEWVSKVRMNAVVQKKISKNTRPLNYF